MAAFRLLVVLLAEAHREYLRLAGWEKTGADHATKGRDTINLAALSHFKDGARTNMLQALECIGEPLAPTSMLLFTMHSSCSLSQPLLHCCNSHSVSQYFLCCLHMPLYMHVLAHNLL